jgi:protein-tyrosine phosphatase
LVGRQCSAVKSVELSCARMSGYVDLHAHHLFALDDGAADIDVALSMVRAVADLGFSDLYATPHQRAGMFLPTRQSINEAHADLAALLRTSGGPHLGLGFENFWDDVLLQRITDGAIPSYNDGPAFLFEVSPQLMPPRIETTLFDLRLRGKLPVMAHPERYVAIQKQIGRAQVLARSAALVIDLAALDGAHGKAEMHTARQLLRDGLVHAAATDIHSPDDAPAIAAGINWIRKQLGQDALTTLLSDNPRRILAGELPELRS